MSARSELVALVGSGRVTRERLAPGRAVDLGCGAGANAVFLAQTGFDVVGIDFSPVALRKARRASLAAGMSEHVRLVRADLTAQRLPGVEGPFDLLVDYGTLDDLATSAIRLSDPRGALPYPRPNGSGGALQRVDDDSDFGFVGREVWAAQTSGDDRPGGRRVDLRVGTDRSA